MADEFGGIDTRAEILRIIGELTHASKETVVRQVDTTVVTRRRHVGSRWQSRSFTATRVTAVTQHAPHRNRFAFFQL